VHHCFYEVIQGPVGLEPEVPTAFDRLALPLLLPPIGVVVVVNPRSLESHLNSLK
jgi:hypothetical protein